MTRNTDTGGRGANYAHDTGGQSIADRGKTRIAADAFAQGCLSDKREAHRCNSGTDQRAGKPLHCQAYNAPLQSKAAAFRRAAGSV